VFDIPGSFTLLPPPRRLCFCLCVAWWTGCWTCDQQVATSELRDAALASETLGRLFAHVTLSPSSIIGTSQRAVMFGEWERKWCQPTAGDDFSHLGADCPRPESAPDRNARFYY